MIALTLTVAVYVEHRNSGEALLQEARRAAERRDWESALELASRATRRDPSISEAWWLVAQSNARINQYAGAVSAWEQIPESSPWGIEARLKAAETCLHELRNLRRAEQHYRRLIVLDAENSAAVDGLAQTLAIGGRWRELAPVLLRLIQLDTFTNFHLDLLARGSEINVDPQLLPAPEQLQADDEPARLARLRLLLSSQQPQTVIEELSTLHKHGPPSTESELLMGRALLLTDDDERLKAWLKAGLASLQNDAEYWSIALASCPRWHDEAGAAHCAWEVVSRDPHHVGALLTLGRSLNQHGKPELATLLLRRAELLEQYAASVTSARQSGNWNALAQAEQLAEQLGMLWEAWGWTRLAARLNPRLTWAQPAMDRLRPQIAALPLERTAADFLPTRRIPVNPFPRPSFDLWVPPPSPDRNRDSSIMTFEDAAAQTGLHVQYNNGGRCLIDGLRYMYELTGGGVGVVDFDRDQWPDLYFPQGGKFTNSSQPQTQHDQLWRNLGGEAWDDVTSFTGLTDEEFGQGISVGDVDEDGFPDLLVLNIGRSRLWHNQGDGTFIPSHDFGEVLRPAWSISGGIADLDGDAVPDVYIVNYLAGDDVFQRICPDAQGVARLTCQPLVFPAAADQLLRGQGNGRFDDASQSAGINQPAARGMGVLIGRLTQVETMDVFVTNDSTANHHYIRQPATAGLQYLDEAFRLGTAVDGAGRAQACMGVAADDVDGDGRFDLFVTNFEDEANTLYQQQDGGLFTDRTREFALDDASRPMLGFGTQFLDADLDGYPELIVANGHVNDRRETGSMYQMPPQLFRNQQGSRFQLVPAKDAGDYFNGRYLGRGLAVLDANRDGLPDAVVTHLDRPAALLLNRSVRRGNWLQLQLVGTKSSRDAIATRVVIHGGDRKFVRQLLSGDGYASSNQRLIFSGLGTGTSSTVRIEVLWPDGTGQTFDSIPVDRCVAIIQGRPGGLTLSH